jgi:hypothetical protein
MEVNDLKENAENLEFSESIKCLLSNETITPDEYIECKIFNIPDELIPKIIVKNRILC